MFSPVVLAMTCKQVPSPTVPNWLLWVLELDRIRSPKPPVRATLTCVHDVEGGEETPTQILLLHLGLEGSLHWASLVHWGAGGPPPLGL